MWAQPLPQALPQSFASPYSGVGAAAPYSGGFSPYPGSTQTFANQATSGGSGFNMEQLKSIFGRMGGLDGIIGTMTKVNKLVQGFQQMSPLIKLLAGSFLGGAKVKTVKKSARPYRTRRRTRRRRPPVRPQGRRRGTRRAGRYPRS